MCDCENDYVKIKYSEIFKIKNHFENAIKIIDNVVKIIDPKREKDEKEKKKCMIIVHFIMESNGVMKIEDLYRIGKKENFSKKGMQGFLHGKGKNASFIKIGTKKVALSEYGLGYIKNWLFYNDKSTNILNEMKINIDILIEKIENL